MITEKLIGQVYQQKTTPYKHQQDKFEESRDKKYYAFFWEMGVGKSKPIVDTMGHLFLKGEIDGVLIVADKGCYLNWYNNEVPIHLSDKVPYRMAYWGSSMNAEGQRKAEKLLVAKDDVLDIMCINIEAFSGQRGTQFAAQFLRSHYVMMVVDESTSIKSHKAMRTKTAMKLGALCEYRRIATGTPITQSPLDLFCQCQFLQPGCINFTSFTAFKSYYAVIHDIVMGTRRFPKIIGYRNLDDLTKSIQPFSSRLLKTECLDLPEKIYEIYYVEQTPEQEKAYTKLQEEAMLQFEQGLLTTTSALTTIGKLHQINCGHVKLDDKTTVDLPSNRVSSLISILEGVNGKVLIWGHYQRDIQLIVGAILDNFGPGSVVDYYGETSDENRETNLKEFKNNPYCRFFVGTPATGGKSLTLTEANTVIYYSNHYNLERRLQSEDRAHRIGQKNNVVYIDLVVEKTVDEKIVKALKMKKDLASEVLDNLRNLLFTEQQF